MLIVRAIALDLPKYPTNPTALILPGRQMEPKLLSMPIVMATVGKIYGS